MNKVEPFALPLPISTPIYMWLSTVCSVNWKLLPASGDKTEPDVGLAENLIQRRSSCGG